jgi:deoxyribodipyrimidine photo-lyase
MMHERGLFLFHRDLRIQDNTGLLQASRECEKVYTAFIFTPEQVGKLNPYKSVNSVHYMIESLSSLAKDIREAGGSLITLYGKNVSMIRYLIDTLRINCLYFNADCTPYAIKRDDELAELCDRMGIQCRIHMDYYLQVPGSVVNGSGKMYQKFTPFYEAMMKKQVFRVDRYHPKNLASNNQLLQHRITIADALDVFIGNRQNPDRLLRGGRDEAVDLVRRAVRHQRHYEDTRDMLSISTSHLSAALKYGTVSVREVYHSPLKHVSEFIRQLIWRDFFAHILYAYPESLGKLYFANFRRIPWSNNQAWLEAWKQGETGFPVVDAGMRELVKTGYMHNRCRMIVAEFLVKTMRLDWREGERFFAQHLIDYDVASNSGNWQSIVGGGVYSMPWFRIMNPWIQSAKYDPDADYIKKWVPELSSVLPRDIHRWNQACTDEKYREIEYPKPIVNHEEQKTRTLALYKRYV